MPAEVCEDGALALLKAACSNSREGHICHIYEVDNVFITCLRDPMHSESGTIYGTRARCMRTAALAVSRLSQTDEREKYNLKL